MKILTKHRKEKILLSFHPRLMDPCESSASTTLGLVGDPAVYVLTSPPSNTRQTLTEVFLLPKLFNSGPTRSLVIEK